VEVFLLELEVLEAELFEEEESSREREEALRRWRVVLDKARLEWVRA
jgi:hypothetical protein